MLRVAKCECVCTEVMLRTILKDRMNSLIVYRVKPVSHSAQCECLASVDSVCLIYDVSRALSGLTLGLALSYLVH